MIIARIESLILDKGMDDAVERAEAYIEAGADAIMIHSRRKEPDEVFEFCERARVRQAVPIVACRPATTRSPSRSWSTAASTS
jgi:phosphoenolpyruvate phosphomutase / 2-hydroxyethylphosphonate cytidylyltransferase